MSSVKFLRRIALGCALLAATSACSREPERHSVLLITMDTTRADVLGCYKGGKPGITPNIEALAREAIVFDRARTVAPLTQPAHASMLTGLYPPRHGMRDNGLVPLPNSARTLAEAARDAGYQTAAFLSAAVLDRVWGLAQGFDVYESPRSDAAHTTVLIHDRVASETAEHALAWLARRDKQRPYFLWVHFFDPHSPYVPPKQFLDQASGVEYLGEVAAMDHSIGRVIDALRAEGTLDETVVLAVSDHGESLGQHGEPTHSTLCYEPTIKAPFLLRLPRAERGGTRSNDVVSVVDVLPTLLEAMALEVPSSIDGVSVYTPGQVPADRAVYFESYCGYLNFHWAPLAGVADARGKYLHTTNPQLFDADQDPFEKVDLVQQRAADAETYRTRLHALVARPPLARDEEGAISDDAHAQIQALGYAGAGDPSADLPGPLDHTPDRPSPHLRTKELRAIHRATIAGEQGDRAQAIAALREILAENEKNSYALDLLAKYSIDDGQVAEAIELLRRRHALGKARATSHLNLARCLDRTGDLAGAAEQYRIALQERPDDPELLREFVGVLERLGNESEARAFRARLDAR